MKPDRAEMIEMIEMIEIVHTYIHRDSDIVRIHR
jgi:hypothetical protein